MTCIASHGRYAGPCRLLRTYITYESVCLVVCPMVVVVSFLLDVSPGCESYLLAYTVLRREKRKKTDITFLSQLPGGYSAA